MTAAPTSSKQADFKLCQVSSTVVTSVRPSSAPRIAREIAFAGMREHAVVEERHGSETYAAAILPSAGAMERSTPLRDRVMVCTSLTACLRMLEGVEE